MDFTTADRARMIELLEEKMDRLEKLYTHTQEQAALLDEEDDDRFSENVILRQKQVDGLDGIQKEIKALNHRYAAGAADREIDALLAATDGKLREIIAMDQRMGVKARELANKFKNEVKKSSETRKTVVKYGQTGMVFGSDYFDKMS